MRALHAAVLATRRVPGLRALYGGLYRGGAAACAAALAGLDGVESVLLHRGAARGRVDPGVSDVDLIVVRRPLPPEAEAAWLARLAARRRALRGLFPPLGDLWVGTPAELALYLRRGGLRAWEDPPAWRALAGVRPGVPAYDASVLKRELLDPWVWCLVSYMDLSRRAWTDGRDLPAKREADLRKMYRETARLALAVLGRTPPSPREARLPGPDPERADPRELWLAAAGLLGEASRAALARLPRAGTAVPAFPVDARLEPLRRSCGAGLLVVNPPYHAWAVLDDEADAGASLRAAEALASSGRPEAPLVLPASAWALALQSSYLGAPLGRLGGGADGADGLFAGWGPAACGTLGEVPRLDAALRRETAAEAASWMLLWWRALWADEATANRFALYHLYTRALGLRQALDGREAPFDGWGAALAAAASHRGTREAAEGLTRWAREEPPACLDAPTREALAPEHAAALARLMAGLASALEAA